jgi:hypothetical protein
MARWAKKQLFDLEFKGQGPTKIITVHETPPYGHAPKYQISLTYLERQKCYGPEKKILSITFLSFEIGQLYLVFGCMTIRRCVVYHNYLCGTHIPNKYYLKNNYLALRSKVKVPRRSLRYATHRLMVMHPNTKYHWPISKDKNVMARRRKYYLIGQLYLVFGCMTIRRCVVYHNYLCGTLTFDIKAK